MPSNPVHIGAVSYLNTKPLIHSLAERSERIHLSLDLPSRLATDLRSGKLDIALIPSVELFRLENAKVVSDACIGCRGPVWSVKLISRVPFDQVKTLALDEGSRTSVGLAQILLRKRFGIYPMVSSLPIEQSPLESPCDAVLVIGDRAMNLSADHFPYQWDLGQQWCEWTGLPFVFAMWVTLTDEPDPDLIQALAESRDDGVAQIENIARREAAGYGLTPDQCQTYLRDNLNFFLHQKERAALELYQQYLYEFKLISEIKTLDFYECQTS